MGFKFKVEIVLGIFLLVCGCATMYTNVDSIPTPDVGAEVNMGRKIPGTVPISLSYHLVNIRHGTNDRLNPNSDLVEGISSVLIKSEIFEKFEIFTGKEQVSSKNIAIEIELIRRTNDNGCPQFTCLFFSQDLLNDGLVKFKVKSFPDERVIYQLQNEFSIEIQNARLSDPKFWFIPNIKTFNRGINSLIENQLADFRASDTFAKLMSKDKQ